MKLHVETTVGDRKGQGCEWSRSSATGHSQDWASRDCLPMHLQVDRILSCCRDIDFCLQRIVGPDAQCHIGGCPFPTSGARRS